MPRPSSALVAALVAGAVVLPTAVAGADTSPPGNLGNGLARLLGARPAPGRHPAHDAPLAIRDDGAASSSTSTRRRASVAGRRAPRGQAAGLRADRGVGRRTGDRGLRGARGRRGGGRRAGRRDGVAGLEPQPNVGAATSQGVRAQRADGCRRHRRQRDHGRRAVGLLRHRRDRADRRPAHDPRRGRHPAGDLPADGVTVVEENPSRRRHGRGPRACCSSSTTWRPAARQCFATALRGDCRLRAQHPRAGRPAGPVRRGRDRRRHRRTSTSRSSAADRSATRSTTSPPRACTTSAPAGNGSTSRPSSRRCGSWPPDGATAGTNIELSGVDPALYAGGFHDFDAGPGQSTSRRTSWVDGTPAILDLQWDDPVDRPGRRSAIRCSATTGELTAAADRTHPVRRHGGSDDPRDRGRHPLRLDGPRPLPQGPDGGLLDRPTPDRARVDRLHAAGDRHLHVRGARLRRRARGLHLRRAARCSSSDAHGPQRARVRCDGRLCERRERRQPRDRAAGRDHRHPGRRAPAARHREGEHDAGAATQLRYCCSTAHRSTSTSSRSRRASSATRSRAAPPRWPPTTRSGRSCRRASPRSGGDLPILFDSGGNRLPQPDVRRAPQIAAADGGNTTFFVADSVLDDDTPAELLRDERRRAPRRRHRRARAAGERRAGLDDTRCDARAAGGSAFRHDLDPFITAGATAGGLTVSADGTPGQERRDLRPRQTTPGAMNDPRLLHGELRGTGWLDRAAHAQRRGRERDKAAIASPLEAGSSSTRGRSADCRCSAGRPCSSRASRSRSGRRAAGIAPDDVSATFSRASVGNANAEQFQRMTVTFAPGALTAGRSVAFGVDRDEAVTAAGDAEAGNSADQLGRGCSSRRAAWTGAPGCPGRRSRRRAGSQRHDPRPTASGWTPVDGFGFVNAEAAVARAR